MDGVFGSAEPVTEPTAGAVDEADIYLGYAKPPVQEPEPEAAPQAQDTAQDGPESTDEGDSSSEGASDDTGAQEGGSDGTASQDDPAAAWQKEKQQYQQAIQQYEQTLAQLLAMFQTNPYAQMGQGAVPGTPQVPGQQAAPMQAPAPTFGQFPIPGQAPGYTVDPVTGYPISQGVVPTPHVTGQAPQQAQGQNAAAPAAPSDEELTEQFWQEPVKAARALVEREWDRLVQEKLLPLIAQREAYFGQVFGTQIMAPLVQQVVMVQDEIAWRDRISREYQSLRSKHEDFDQVAPVIQQMLNEDPQRFVRLRQGQETLEKLYREAKKRVATQGRQLTSIPGGKGAARMPRAGAARVASSADDNDALVEAALGPMDQGGIWG